MPLLTEAPVDLNGYDPFLGAEDYYFDLDSANRAIEFIETFCCHKQDSISARAGNPLVLER